MQTAMLGAMMLAIILVSVAVVAIKFVLVRRVRPDIPVHLLFAGDRSLPRWSDAIDEASERTDMVTVTLLRPYRVARAVFIVLFALVCGMVLLKNMTSSAGRAIIDRGRFPRGETRCSRPTISWKSRRRCMPCWSRSMMRPSVR